MRSYDNGLDITYRFLAASVTGGAATFGRFIGPKLLTGRIESLSYIVTTGVTTTAPTLIVSGTTVMTVAISSANAGASATEAQLKTANATLLAADTVATVGTNGAAAAGAADVTLVVRWF